MLDSQTLEHKLAKALAIMENTCRDQCKEEINAMQNQINQLEAQIIAKCSITPVPENLLVSVPHYTVGGTLPQGLRSDVTFCSRTEESLASRTADMQKVVYQVLREPAQEKVWSFR